MVGVPTAVWILVALVAVILVATVVDIARHDVQHLPRWAWILIVVLVSFPIGVIVYVAIGRAPRAPAIDGPATGVSAPLAPPSNAAIDAVRRLPPTAATSAGPGRPLAVATHALTKTYGATTALSEVDLAVPSGATYGLIGPNGSGKTTMLSILAGLRRPTSGTIELAAPRRRMGLLVDTPLFEPWLTAREVVDLARHLTAPDLPSARTEEVLVEVGLADAIDRRTGGFSRGMLQRLGLAGCLVGDPEVLILDEPSSALDPAGRREVLDIVGRLAHTKTVLLSTHILADVQQVCDTVGVIDHGRLRYQGPLADLLARTSSAFVLHVRAPAAELTSLLQARAWVDDVEEFAPGRLRVRVSDATVAEHEIPSLVARAGVAMVSFNPATDLESAFLELTT